MLLNYWHTLFRKWLQKLLKPVALFFANYKYTKFLTLAYMWWVEKNLQRSTKFILQNGNVRDIQGLGEIYQKDNDPQVKNAGKLVSDNAERFVLLRVFKRWL